jgi:hypothetical protein
MMRRANFQPQPPNRRESGKRDYCFPRRVLWLLAQVQMIGIPRSRPPFLLGR